LLIERTDGLINAKLAMYGCQAMVDPKETMAARPIFGVVALQEWRYAQDRL
jgi:hypothetical protein